MPVLSPDRRESKLSPSWPFGYPRNNSEASKDVPSGPSSEGPSVDDDEGERRYVDRGIHTGTSPYDRKECHEP